MTMVADVFIPKLYPKAGQLIMQSWHFSPEIIVVAREHLNIQRTGTQQLELADIALLAHHLNQMTDIKEDIIPEAQNLEPAYIVFENYEKILQWNRFLRFALAVCTLKEKFENVL